MVLTDDNFATIVGAVREGRTLYENILKFIRFQLSTTMGAVMTVFFGPVLGFPEPFTPIQILWVALIMDGPPAVSLSLDPPRPGVMRGRPRDPGNRMLTLRRTWSPFWEGRDYVLHMKQWKAATLIAHGFNDWNVMPEHSVRIATALKGRVPLRMYFHQGGHGGNPPMEMVNRWFSRFLYDIPNGVDKGPRAWIVRRGSFICERRV